MVWSLYTISVRLGPCSDLPTVGAAAAISATMA